LVEFMPVQRRGFGPHASGRVRRRTVANETGTETGRADPSAAEPV